MYLNQGYTFVVVFLFSINYSIAQDCTNVKEGKIIPHPFECSFFYRCGNDSIPDLLEKCPKGLYFDFSSSKERCLKHSSCNPTMKVNLINHASKYKNKIGKHQNKKKSFRFLSPPQPNDYIQLVRDIFDCRRFYKNNDLYSCPDGYAFDSIFETCVPKKHCPCQKMPDVVCENENDFIADPFNCKQFWRCSNGKKYLFSCRDGLFFDPGLKVCNWEQYVMCNRC